MLNVISLRTGTATPFSTPLLKRCAITLRAFGWAVVLWLGVGQAYADLMVYPTRIVFEKNQRAAQLELINNGQESATYRISIVNRRMSEIGEFSPADQPLPGERFADDLLRYSPRQVVLAPGAGQTIRISLRKPADLAAGEYRSHLQFERVPDAQPDRATPKLGTEEVGVQLRALIGVSIPLIVRHGETEASVTLGGLELLKPAAADQSPLLAAVLHRSGSRSVYGDIGVTFTPRGGQPTEVAKAGGIAVYTPNPLRRVKLELKPPPGLVLAGGTLRLSYRDRPEAGGKLLAEAAVELP